MTKWFALPLALLAGSVTAAQPDIEHILSMAAQARAKGCNGHAGVHAPLHASDALSRAASRIDRGDPSLTAAQREGYRAVRIFHATFSGYTEAAGVVNAFAQHYCNALSDPDFTDIGVHHEGGKWSIVLAMPLEVPQLADRKAALAQVLALTNEARARARRCGGQPFAAAAPVQWSPRLEEAAQAHSQEMAANAYLDHRGRDGSSPADRVSRAGYRWRSVGENVASGQRTPQEVVDDWLRSPGHCANLMNPGFTEMGAAYGVNMGAPAVVYWTQAFGSPR